jgi:hypothetical protein
VSGETRAHRRGVGIDIVICAETAAETAAETTSAAGITGGDMRRVL